MESNQTLKILSKIKIDNTVETESFSYPCTYKKIGNDIFVHYEEKDENGLKNSCLIKILKDSVEIIKTGTICSDMIFNKEKQTTCKYKTVYGLQQFFIETQSLQTIIKTNIKIMLNYNIYESSTLLGNYSIEMEINNNEY